ncbi:hypothetical protein [Pseudoalteromonas sp. SWN166]|uniref:hypothetical protein n=1 Tax=Pseudoalteromonas sp. SWN166 TaxID=2792061 RepID=UPI0018CCE9C0|nr:hypothetical protein [Pseudoalteromonas sp. SWN166]
MTGIIIGISVAVVLYFAAKAEVEPKYAVQNSRLLAEVTDKTGDLTLLWKKNKIDNLYSTDILMWNAGGNYLDKSMFSETDRLRLCPNENTRILQARFINSSRENLQFSLDENGEKDCLYINIVGDEAIESGDGGLINVLFSGNQDSEFTINGRIKGYKNGFQVVEWDEVVLKMDNTAKFLFPVIVILQLLMCGYLFISITKRLINDDDNSKFDYVMSGSCFIMILSILYVIYDRYGALVFGVPWVTS